ncbi:hypothetical protein [Luteolibacter sp. AS25]|uniref:hypothetical protein n=1 Tax=Luteolibacter sp. AS25 TaxID=3135776 RepID=UPI00398B4D2E
MAKEKEKVELRPIDEESSAEEAVIRLHKGGASEISDNKVAAGDEGVAESGKNKGTERRERKMRPKDPSIDKLNQANAVVAASLENEWQKEEGGGKRFLWSWLVVLLAVLGVGILWAVTKVGRSQEKGKALVEQVDQVLEKEKVSEAEAEKVVSTISNTVKKVLEAESVDEMLGYVRHPERVGPLMLDYYSREPLVTLEIEEIAALQPITVETYATFWGVGCRLSGGGYEQLLVEILENGEAKVDWETLVLYQPMDWNEFVRSRPRGFTGDFRVNVTDDNFFSHEFADSKKYLSLRLSVFNEEEVIFGYVEKASPAGLEIQRIFEENENELEIPMILTLHVPEEAISSKGVVVLAMRSPRWMYVESPEQEVE